MTVDHAKVQAHPAVRAAQAKIDRLAAELERARKEYDDIYEAACDEIEEEA